MRPSLIAASHALEQNVRSIIHGLDDFLVRHTGDVDDNGDNVSNAFIINSEGVIANNLHFEGGPQDYTPTQCATTEGQALLILGYYYAYRGTGNPAYLQKAEYFFRAYVTYFYGGQSVPNPPDIYRANWMLNAKNPFEVYGPPNALNDQSPGVYGLEVTFVNGVGVIPAGSPNYGDQLVKVYKVFAGKFAYSSVRAGPARGGASKPWASFTATNGTWSSKYDPLPTPAGQAVGTVVLEDTTFNGTLSVSYVAHSGVMIPRNQPFDVWPTWRSLTPDQFGNAIDAEQWFAEAALLLFRETGNQFYNQVYQCALATCLQASVVDDVTYYFRRVAGVDPMAYGISYWWNYTPTNSRSTIDRNSDGYIVATKTAETGDRQGTFALEQIAVFNQIGPDTSIRHAMSMDSPTARIDFYTLIQSAVDSPAGTKYRFSLPQGGLSQMQAVNVPFNKMIADTMPDGSQFIMFDGQNYATWGAGTAVSTYETFTLNGKQYSDYVCTTRVPDNVSGAVAGFWLLNQTSQAMAPLTYKSVSGTMYLVVKDAKGFNYWFQLPQADDWTTVNLTWDMFTLVPYQSGSPSATPTPGLLTQVEFETNNSDATIKTYCWGAVPPIYAPNGEWSTKWFIHASDSAAFNWLVGDVVIQRQANQPLAYTPGVVPFSNQYSPSKRRNEFWRGTPYTGYQHPVNWLNASLPAYYENVIQFLYDAQQAYRQRIGVMGPFAPLYVWPRFDNLGEGTIGTFDWGSDQPYPWAGYEARAFWSACHLWAELVRQGKPVNPKLVTVCQNYAQFLLTFQQSNGGLTPSKFPRNAPPFNDGYSAIPTENNPDNVGHMTGLFLAGCVEMLNAGDTSGYARQVAKGLLTQLNLTYVVTQGADQDMSGSFSSWAGGHYFYGFWAGEILRGLGLYLEWVAAGGTL
ncbi:hypothetical protein [Burkholderia ubonensis]|uniref:Uncharacterized protein n=1 Tax=Burkholderia ubonensis TaxID=101571 RepID=A0ABD4E1D9_9BURK|nr:hypothetical protein [Burkholderia ubonensis]KVN83446.1 hypothetical protein WJ68_16160 [Burkholderia ubonensis]